MANAGLTSNEPVEFWKDDEYGPRIQINSFVSDFAAPSDINQAQRKASRSLSQQFPDLEVVQETKLVHEGNPAIEVMAVVKTDNNNYHVIQRCIFARERVFVITCAAFESSFLAELPTFRQSMNSIEILGDRGPLIRPATYAALLVGFVASGFILRRISLARLKRTEQ